MQKVKSLPGSLFRSDNEVVNKLALWLFVLIHIFGIATRSSAFATEFIAKFEITHSHHHEHSDEHQHEHKNVEFDGENALSKLPTEEHTHQHEVIVSSQILYLPNDSYSCLLKAENLVTYPNLNLEPPQGPFPLGIFRPPIQG